MGIGHRFKEITPPPNYVTKDEVQEMIDDAALGISLDLI